MLPTEQISLIVLFLLFGKTAISQSAESVQDNYDEFLELEFSEPKKAKQALESGIKEAKSLGNDDLIGFGYKYLSWYYDDLHNFKSSLQYADSCLFYFTKSKNELELLNGYNFMGNILSDMALLDSSLFWYQKSYNLAHKNNDQEGIAKVSNNMGLVYTDLGDYVVAIDFFHESIDVSKGINDSESVGDAYNNLGSLFAIIEDYEQALKYHELALDLRKKGDDKVRLSSVLLNMGRLHMILMNYEEARLNFHQSLAIDTELEDVEGIALNYNNIGLSYFQEGLLDSTKKYYDSSFEIRLSLNDPFGLIMSYNNYGEYYSALNQHKKAVENCTMAYTIGDKYGLLYDKQEACNCLTNAYDKLGNYSQAYRFLKESVELQEQLISEEDQKELTKNEMQFVFHYQNLEDSLKRAEIQAKKDGLTALELKQRELETEKALSEKRSQFLIFSFAAFFLLAIVALIFYSYKKQKRKTELIREKNDQIKEQKREIDQSISYAQMIQDTALPSFELDKLFKDSFLLFLPRDIVSGDFYWLEENEDQVFFAAADCTGHGIPGAFISMIGTILLNEIYNSKKLRAPNEILDELNRLIQLTLMSRTGVQMKDGMDISFCRWDKKDGVLHYSGANNPLWIASTRSKIEFIEGGFLEPEASLKGVQMFEIKSDKQPIGKYMDTRKSFTQSSLKLESGDMVYVFSDGYPDQFGGDKGKKYKYKPFKELLLKLSQSNGSVQHDELLKEFRSWKGDYEQIDDVCIIGVRV